MKANELMIGDWVMLCGHNVKICSVNLYIGDGDTMAGQHYVLTDPQVGFSNSWVSLLKPISITPEILEKNGFSRPFVNDDYFVYKDGADIKFEIDYNISNKALYVNLGLIPKPICYVHELRHALRLCGIEKEIVL